MRCPHCSAMDDKVLESRQNSSGSSIRRRRECNICGYRFTSYERIEDKPLMVVKRDGRREPFDLNKIGRGGVRSCTENMKISENEIDLLLQSIEDAIMLKVGSKREIASSDIGTKHSNSSKRWIWLHMFGLPLSTKLSMTWDSLLQKSRNWERNWPNERQTIFRSGNVLCCH